MPMDQAGLTGPAKWRLSDLCRLMVAVIALAGVDLAVTVRPARAIDAAWVAGSAIGVVGGLMLLEAARQADAQARAKAQADRARAKQQAKSKQNQPQTANKQSKPAKPAKTPSAAPDSAPTNVGQTSTPTPAAAAAPPALAAPPPTPVVVQSPPRETVTNTSTPPARQIKLMSEPAY